MASAWGKAFGAAFGNAWGTIEQGVKSPAKKWIYSYSKVKNRFFDRPTNIPTSYVDDSIIDSELDGKIQQDIQKTDSTKYKPVDVSFINSLSSEHERTARIISSMVEKAEKYRAAKESARLSEINRLDKINEEEFAISMLMMQ